MVRMSRLSERTADRLTVALFASVVGLGLAGTVLTVVAWGDLKPADAYPNVLSAFARRANIVPQVRRCADVRASAVESSFPGIYVHRLAVRAVPSESTIWDRV